ncbi:MAG: T9SS type A sorting domain-containing protein [candidate division WOR-3 bacterium]|nr:MAG: T9SS type A sorting domain-containing protein [candidate division WOR-3 bacterium]
MEKILRVYIIILAFCVVGLYSQTWTECAPIPTPRWYPASVVLNGKIYVIGGQDSTYPYASLNTVEVYNPLTDTWESKTPLMHDRWGLMAAVVNGKIYAIGGRFGSASGGHSATNVVEEYDPGTDMWTLKAPMPTARGYGGCGVFNDTIFVFGGRLNSAVTAVEKYYPAADSWYSDPPMTVARYTFATALVDNKFYLIGGWGSTLVQEYDPVTKTWVDKTPIPTARGGSGSGVVNMHIYVVGGRGGNSNEFECYNPVDDVWTTLVPMPTPREGLTAAVINNKFFAITGSVPVSQGGLPYYGKNEMADSLTAVEEKSDNSLNGCLFQHWPNPFRTSTTAYYSIPYQGRVVLSIYDVSGRKVKPLVNKLQNAGDYTIEWKGKDSRGLELPSGTYFFNFRFNDYSKIEKCLIIF